jgi:hypothetical protein
MRGKLLPLHRLFPRAAPDPTRSGPRLSVFVIAAHDLRTMTARLCWRRGDFAGVVFESEPVV